MDGVDITASCRVCSEEEMSHPGNKKQTDSTSSHGPGNSPNPQPFEPGEDTVLPHFLSLRDVEAPAFSGADLFQMLEGMEAPVPAVAPRAEPRQILKNVIGRALLKETDGGDWEGVRIRLKYMTLGEALGIWQTIGNEIAVDCFDTTGNVDVERLRTWMDVFGNAEIFREEPFCFIPHAELTRSQIHGVCECLVLNQNGIRDRLNEANGITVGPHWQSILEATSQGREPLLRPAEAALASLFPPHRQKGTPTCTIHSLINEEIRNHPERLISMYIQMLSKDQITFPSGYAVPLRPIVDGSITVDLKNGGKGRDFIFEDIESGDLVKVDAQKAEWQQGGIKYTESADPAEKYKLRVPVHNMNDLLFAHIFQASNFGNRKICDFNGFGTTLIYAGHSEYSSKIPMVGLLNGILASIYPLKIQVDESKFLSEITKLKKQAEVQRQLGRHYMHVGTMSSHGGHGENFDIRAILDLDLNTMEPGRAYPIGDRNWAAEDMSQDIPRLAVRKVDGTPPTYEFGTLENGSEFKRDNILWLKVHSTEIKKFAPQGILSFFRSLNFFEYFLVSVLLIVPLVLFIVWLGCIGLCYYAFSSAWNDIFSSINHLLFSALREML
ncbi:MAG: hypothetical protein LBC11_01960 [Puniceicoccales bacterium]|jgi:hypothetical protein|nr:hypothetical protein [Puniceicoccales bacterium]